MIVSILPEYKLTFDFTINNWVSFAPLLSTLGLIITLMFLIFSQHLSQQSILISEKTLIEIKKQRIDCIFRSKTDTHSGVIRTPIPFQSGQ